VTRRAVVLDENLPGRLATELKRRGRRATHVSELQLRGAQDPDLLAAIDQRLDDWILITADLKMPAEHASASVDVSATLAIVGRAAPGWATGEWWREVVHR